MLINLVLSSPQHRGACDFVENFKLVLKRTIFVVAKDFSCWAANIYIYAICALSERENEITSVEECRRRSCNCPAEGAVAGARKVWVDVL